VTAARKDGRLAREKQRQRRRSQVWRRNIRLPRQNQRRLYARYSHFIYGRIFIPRMRINVSLAISHPT